MDWNDLEDFRISNKIKGKGALALMVQLTRSFSKDSLPIDPDDYVTGKQGQVAGLGEGNLKKILADHGFKGSLQRKRGEPTAATWV